MDNLTPFQKAVEFYKSSQNPNVETRIFLTSILGMQKELVDAAITEIEESLDAKSAEPKVLNDAEPVAGAIGRDGGMRELTPYAESTFKQIAMRAVARGEKRALPIQVGGKNPLIGWAHLPIHNASTREWEGLYQEWIDSLGVQFPNANACVIANKDEFLFIDEDLSREFRKGYEAFAGEPFPVTYATSARENRCQSHWLQTDATRQLGNVAQGATKDQMISVRQHQLYVLAEGSVHKNGVDIYKVVVDAPIIPMPDKLVEYIQSIRTDRNAQSGDFNKKPENWLEAPFIHGNINNQVAEFIGHYISNKNINDPEELFTLMQARIEKNGCFEPDGITPFAWKENEVRGMCREKVTKWKTGEQESKEAVEQALAEGQQIAAKARDEIALTQSPEPVEVVEVFTPNTVSDVWQKSDMSLMVMNGRLGEICDERLLKYFPVSYAWTSLIAVASAMVPRLPVKEDSFISQDDSMLNSFTGLVGPIHSGKSQAILWALGILGVPEGHYTDIKAGSSEGLLRKLAQLRASNKLKDTVLIDLDEWKHLFNKAGIENSSFTTFLHTAFYKRKQNLLLARGKEASLDCALSFIGGIVEDEFDVCFGASSMGGLHDRFTFGLCPEGYNFIYRPFEGGREIFDPVPVHVAPEIWEMVESIRKASPNIGREAEIAVRAARVCASFDGVRVLDAKYGERMIRAMIQEQAKVREHLRPNGGMTSDAQCANAMVSWLIRNAADGKLVLERDLRWGLRKTLERLGPGAMDYATRNLVRQGVIWYGPVPNMKPWKGRQPHAYRLMDASGFAGSIYK